MDDFLLTYRNYDYANIFCGDLNSHALTLSGVSYVAGEGGDHVSVEVSNIYVADPGIAMTEPNPDLTPARISCGRKLAEVCNNNQVHIFNERLGEDCAVGNFTTTHKTTIDYFRDSPLVIQCIAYFRVLD